MRTGSLVPLAGQIRPRQGLAFLVDWKGTRAILRSLPAPAGGVSPENLATDTRWLHAFLTRLTALGFPAPRPLPAFAGQSSATAYDAAWEIVSYLPGAAVGWSARPPLEEIGALLACYHATVRQIAVPEQRPTALPLGAVPAVLLSARLDALGIDAGEAGAIRQLASRLDAELADTAALVGDRVVIHGDFTNDNVIASGRPLRATGVIDFALAHAEDPIADLGYALWRSGRPHEHADYLDLNRVRRYVRGYAGAAALPSDRAAAIPVYLMGRGLQMIAKRVRAGRPETGMLAQVQWLSAHRGAIADVVQAAVR